jgi:putative ABC transport system substrate-binding protein
VISRRAFLGTVAGGLLTAPLAAEAQQAGKVWSIGDVFAGAAEVSGALTKALEDRLADRGYVNGRNIRLIHQFVPPEPARLEEALAILISKIDVLVVWGTVSAVAAKKVTSTLPTVFLTVGDPVAIGLVKSLAHPGGNMTGVTFEASAETYGKRLQLLKDLQPDLRRVAVLRAAGDANVGPAMASLARLAPQLEIELQSFDVRSAADLERAFATMKSKRAQGVVVVAGAFTYLNRQRIVDLALTHHLPSSLPFKEAVAVGGLVSLGPDLVEMARQGAAYVAKIIKGSNPGDLPVEQPTRYELALNLKTAKALGLTIPQSLLLRADELIQ